MATGDIWVCVYPTPYVSEILVESYDINADKLFTETVHISDYSYAVTGMQKPLILALEDIIICVAGGAIFTKAPGEGFVLAELLLNVDTTHTAEPLYIAYQEGVYSLVMYMGYYDPFPTYNSYARYYESTDGLTWVQKISNKFTWSLLNVITLNFVYIQPETSRRYFLSLGALNDISIEGGVFYTDNFATYISVYSYTDMNAHFGNDDWDFASQSPLVYNGHLYILVANFTDTEVPQVIKISLTTHTVTYLEFSSGTHDIDLDSYYWFGDTVRSLPDGTPFVLLYEDNYATVGLYKLNETGTAFIRDNALSGDIYWPPYYSSRLDNKPSVSMAACGGTSGSGSTESYEAVFLSDNTRITIPPYYNGASYSPWLYTTVESGPYIPPEEEFWTEERLAIEQSYDY